MMHAAFRIFFFYPFQHFKLHVQEMLKVGIIPLIRYKLVQGLSKILNFKLHTNLIPCFKFRIC